MEDAKEMWEHTPGPCPNCGVNASEVMPLVVKLRLQRDELLAALEAAMRISDLWLPATPSENPNEDIALGIMYRRFAAALKAAKGE